MEISRSKLESMIVEEIQVYKNQHLDEGLADIVGLGVTILSALGSGVTDTLKEELAYDALEYLEIDPTSLIAKVFINFVGNTTLDDLARIILGSDRCEAITEELGDALAETIIESIPEVLGLTSTSRLAKILRESLSKTLTEELSTEISAAICNVDYSTLVNDLPGGGILKRILFRDKK